jgi:hypothetical protein
VGLVDFILRQDRPEWESNDCTHSHPGILQESISQGYVDRVYANRGKVVLAGFLAQFFDVPGRRLRFEQGMVYPGSQLCPDRTGQPHGRSRELPFISIRQRKHFLKGWHNL